MKIQKRELNRTKIIILIVFFLISFINITAQEPFQGGYPSTFGGTYRVYGPSVNPQFNNPSFFYSPGFTSPEIYWPKYNRGDCFERQDFIMQIAPGGCSPSVVTSDLLEEQPVPVFCKIQAIQVNPLIDVSRIRALRFRGEYPRGISSISYFPARAAVQSSRALISSPIQDNLGYAVIVLSKNRIEGEMPEFIEGNITASIDYDVEGAFGIGTNNFYVSELSDEEWLRNYKQYGFWNGKAYVRAESIEQIPSTTGETYQEQATISIYRDAITKQATVTLKRGETSRDIYLSGFYCAAGMNLRLDEVKSPVDTALIQITDSRNTIQQWVARGDRILDGKCWITDLTAYSGGGKVDISCRVQNGKFQLSLNPGKASFKVEEQEKEFIIGEQIKPNIFFAYAGQDTEETEFVVLINDTLSDSVQGFAERDTYSVIEKTISAKTIEQFREKIESEVKAQYKKTAPSKLIDEKIEVKILKAGDKEYGIELSKIFLSKNREWGNTPESLLAKKYYEEAIKNYQDLADFYPSETTANEQEYYAAQGLYQAAQLSKQFRTNQNAQEFYNRLIREYPNSDVANQALRDKELITKFDSSNSKAVVNINNVAYFFDLLDVKKPTKEEASAVFLINGKEINLGLDEVFRDDDKEITVQLKEIDTEYATINYAKTDLLGTGSKSKKLKLKEQVALEDTPVKLLGINLNKQIKITITPKIFGPRTESNFKFKIGIEKRAIKLSPEKTEELIETTEKMMSQWTDVNEKLGKVIKGLKGACFATSAALTIKNLIEGFSGEAMARKKLMTLSGGWNEVCENAVNNGEFVSVQKCLLEKNSQINKDVEIYKEQIETTNKQLEEIQKLKIGIEKSDILDLQGQTDAKKVEDEFAKIFEEFCKEKTDSIILPDNDKTSVKLSEVCGYKTLTHEQRREIMTLQNTKDAIKEKEGSEVLEQTVDNELGKITLDAKNYWEYHGAELLAEGEAKDYGFKATKIAGEKTAMAEIYNVKPGDKISSIPGINPGDKVIRIFVPSKVPGNENYKTESEIADKYVIIKLQKEKNTNDYILEKVYSLDGKSSELITKDVKEYLAINQITNFRESNIKAYKNPMIDYKNLKVKYFERAPYKGLPAEIPFDVEEGWYVHLTYILSGFGKPYDESGRAVNFYICNVGPNGIIEFKKSADDICRYYNGDVSELSFPGMDLGESRLLVNRAQQAISEAARQYNQKTVRIGKNTFGSAISFGGEEARCSDFMSPQDCHLLFNVCDPVICPASRCDLGGDFRVDNVIQTGVIGSLMLCLPNAKEGIFAPICLSGVHAGIEGYLSILNSTNACLKESLETGRNIGICDEIKSIYLCEFFWKQATPFFNVLIPRLIESFFSQGVRGGGEYLTVQSAWDNTNAAIDYFRNEYAVNSVLAFNQRSTEEVGSDICKSYVSVVYPASEELFEKLIEPDSPVQFHAWFSEDTLTTATIPATSHYKVYYHIYSGKDQGAYFAVYLKDLPESNYIYTSGTYIVDSGYIARGSQIDEARDFTAVSGYKQLCINVNGQEECGFGKVSTSYLLNSLVDSYAEEQLKIGIKSEKECVAGTPSAKSLLQPNIQAGVEEMLQPALYNHGIIRICSTENPGKRVLPTGEYDTTASTFDRWKEVGYCDDKTIKCWLDTSSVKDVIQDKGIEEKVLEGIDLNIIGGESMIDETTSRTELSEIIKQIDLLAINRYETESQIENKISPIAEKLIKISNLAATNKYRASAVYYLGGLYKKVAEALLEYSTPPPSPAPEKDKAETLEPSDKIPSEIEPKTIYNYKIIFKESVCDMAVCVEGVGKAIKTIQGVENIKIDLTKGEATFESSKKITEEEVITALAKSENFGAMENPVFGSMTETQPKEDASKKSTTGFTLTDNKIYFNGEYTGYFLDEKSEGRYTINKKGTLWNTRVGTIIDEKISFTVTDDKIMEIVELKDYTFSKDAGFVKK